MSVKIVNYTSKLQKDFDQKSNIFLRLATEQVVRIALPKTPKKQGNLRRDVIKQVLGLKGKVIWGKNYAGYQEEKQFRNYTTPGTGPHFAKNAVSDMIRVFSKIAKDAKLI